MKTIAITAALMCGILLLPHVNAQVEIKQSSTVNGQTTKLQTGGDLTKITTGKYLVSIHQVGDSLKFRICDTKISQIADTCHDYILYKNGTITKGGENTK